MRKQQCAWGGCIKAARARGFCDTHYRRILRRSRGPGGARSRDAWVYKVRVRMVRGSQPYYYSDLRKAMARAAQARAAGTLMYFAEYKFSREIRR